MSHIHQGPLATYNSLADNHLSAYFSNSRMRRHLRKAGLVSKKGEIVSEATYRLNMSRKEHKKQVKDMLAQAIVHKTLDLERKRQSDIKKKLEEISKIQLVRRVRATTGRKGDEDILPFLTPRSRPVSSPAFKSRGRTSHSKFRPMSAPGVRTVSRQSQMSIEEEGDVLYLDDDGRPITPAHNDQQGLAEQSHIDSRHLHSLDTAALRKYAMLMSQMEEGRGLTSPYMISQVPLPPKTPLSGRAQLSARRVHSASPKRPVTTDRKKASSPPPKPTSPGPQSRIARLHRPETAKPHMGDQQMMCRVVMKYHGWALNLAREKTDPRQEVVVEQQHCGGNTLTVFKERLVPGTCFEFISYRHRGFPFSLTLYLDGQMDSRVSTCCEYRHSRGAKIGGKQGHFSLLSVEGAVPCYKCQVAKGVMMRKTAGPKKAKRPSERHMEEVIVVSTKKDDDDGYEKTQERTEQARPVGDANYDDDFESSRSSSRSSACSSASDSESEASSRKDEAADRPTPRRKRDEERYRAREARGEEREASASPVRVAINGTGRQIDDYSSDGDADEKKKKVVSMENVEADDNPVVEYRRASMSSSSSSFPESYTNNTDDDQGRARGDDGANAVISMTVLDRQEKEEEQARAEKERQEEIQRREEEERIQQQQMEKERRMEQRKREEEARRQEEAYEQQMREEAERKKKEERRRQEEERRIQTEKEEEEKRQQEEQSEREARDSQAPNEAGIVDEQERGVAAEERKGEEEEEKANLKEERDERVTEEIDTHLNLSSARTEDSTARSVTLTSRTSSSSSSRSESPESTARPGQPPELEVEEDKGEMGRPSSPLPPAREQPQHLAEPEEDTPPRSVSPFPTAAVYVHRNNLTEPGNLDAARPRSASPEPPRSVSPFPSAAEYDDRETLQPRSVSPEPPRSVSPFPSAAEYEDRETLQPRSVSPEPPRSVSPFPPAAVYEDRRQTREVQDPGQGDVPQVPVISAEVSVSGEDSDVSEREEEQKGSEIQAEGDSKGDDDHEERIEPEPRAGGDNETAQRAQQPEDEGEKREEMREEQDTVSAEEKDKPAEVDQDNAQQRHSDEETGSRGGRPMQ